MNVYGICLAATVVSLQDDGTLKRPLPRFVTREAWSPDFREAFDAGMAVASSDPRCYLG